MQVINFVSPMVNPLTPELKSSAQRCLPRFLLGILMFKGLTVRRLYESYDVKGLNQFYLLYFCNIAWWPNCGRNMSPLHTAWSRVLEKLTGYQIVKKFTTFYGTRSSIAAFTSVPHLSLSWASSIHSIPPHQKSWRSILILASHLWLGLPSVLFLSGFLTKTLYMSLPCPIRTTCPTHLILLDFITHTKYKQLSCCGNKTPTSHV
jgi:hypothetical protein